MEDPDLVATNLSPAGVKDLLRKDLDARDPWNISSCEYEQKRLHAIMELCLGGRTLGDVLEIGCAAGALTERLSIYSQSLTVVELMTEAIAKAQERVNNSDIIWHEQDVCQMDLNAKYDTIICTEVLYYIHEKERLRGALENIVQLLRSDGQFIFGSPRNAVCRSWGHLFGAEAVLELAQSRLRIVDLRRINGGLPGQDCVIAKLTRR
ncbi:nodulation protein S [Azorhizobium caulinodans ORS 571]|uniref:Nodulation protein S n=2 Tax=Azorhizobium caulinodans TaxID=7 RepID=NODS_AZOC5|nr:RecName: Full=Nodulation protein S [Azorhizobium caulinodans ORS 571]AAB51165.1 methyltransferase [Azorhizobium caulinodans ORS 571]BAF89813.1 nodulation protein S [Azorhizobium caulinodans ORS 571]prf//1615305D nodC assocd ORF 4 [Azorhizobium caulinodans]